MISKDHSRRALTPASVQLAALILAALTLCGALAARPARAAEWMQPYLEQVQEWGVMRGDANGDLHEDRSITRAEFVTLVNRAFGYTEVGPSPFTDVSPNDWFAEDISIAHQAGYFNGTSPTTASPQSLVTREQAAVLLGRCLRLQGTVGVADSSFTDVYDIGGWSRGLVQEAADLGIIQGYADGSFRPRQPITRGQMACFLVRALGTLIQEPGEQSSGGVYGNLTITVPGVKLKDTVITGNLYLTGGVGLGNLELENVNVLGKIVICGSGEAERGEHSVILRNVTAGSLEVDSLMDQFLSIRAEGLTNIGSTIVRTSAYLEDLTDDGLGLQVIRLDGAQGVRLQLAGNIKEVLDLTPNSILQLAQGVAGVVTMDEKAVGASLTIDVDSYIKELNLDTATPVTGAGSVTHLNVNAPGSNVSMLPDTIYVRPGITGSISNVNMDNKTAAEASEDPRLLAGYPAARNIAPTSADAVFRTNKTGTIRWAITALMDGSVGEEELMDPASYSKILRSGTINATASNTDFTARLTGLTKEGSYYISALLVDARGRRSPVKVAAFTTPDDTAPNFATGYPQAPILTADADGEQVAQIMVMATKDCQMYYVLLPKGSTAPTAADFRAAALPGNLGYGVVTLRKNTPFLLSRINTSHLQEKTDYDLYLWLNDADNGKSSAIRKITVTTKDVTPPTILDLSQRSNTANSVTIRFILDEPGTLSWAAVKQGASIRVDKENPTQYDQIRIENIAADGVTVIRRGGPVRAAQGGTEYTFTVSGLQGQTSYDLYYMAKDTAGNYCIYNETIEFPYPIRTQDTENPTAWMDFTDYDMDSDIQYPRLDSNVMIQFSEVVDGYFSPVTGGNPEGENLEELYMRVLTSTGDALAQAKTALGTVLQRHISFHTGTPPGQGNPPKGSEVEVIDNSSTYTAEQLDELPAWIDYREAVITRREVDVPDTGQRAVGLCITFPAGKGIKLQSGGRYFFHLNDFWDSVGLDLKVGTAQRSVNLPAFSTASARVDIVENENGDVIDDRDLTIFRLEPNDATSYSPESARWDMLLWAHSNIEFDLYVRQIGGAWLDLGRTNIRYVDGKRAYRSLIGTFGEAISSYPQLHSVFGAQVSSSNLPYLRNLTEDLEFGILPTEDGMSGDVRMEAELYTGTNAQFRGISTTNQGMDDRFASLQTPLERISNPKAYVFTVFSNLSPVVSIRPRGIQILSESEVRVNVTLSLPGRVYCLAIPVTDGERADYNLPVLEKFYPKEQPTDIGYVDLLRMPTSLTSGEDELWLYDRRHPAIDDIVNEDFSFDDQVKYRRLVYPTTGDQSVNFSDLIPSTTYILYLISEDPLGNPAERTLCYRFTTNEAQPPKIALTSNTQQNLINVRVKPDAHIRYIMVRSDQLSGTYFDYPFYAGSPYVDAEKGPLPTSYKGTTVREAMHTLLDGDGDYFNSVFDLYATEDIKRLCQGAIVNPSSTGSLPPSSVGLQDSYTESTLPMDETGFFSYGNLPDDVAYTLFAVAWTESSQIYGFRAEYDYSKTSTTPLRVIDCAFDQTNNHLYLTFNVQPWLWVSINERYPIDNCQNGITHTGETGPYLVSSNGYTRLGALMNFTGRIGFADAAYDHEQGFYSLEFSYDVPSSAASIVFRNLCNSAGATVTTSTGARADLIIRLQNDGTAAEPDWQAHYSRAFGGDLDA